MAEESVPAEDEWQSKTKRLLSDTMSSLDEFADTGDVKEGAYNDLSKRLKTLYDTNTQKHNLVTRAEKLFFIRLAVEHPHLLSGDTGSIDINCRRFLRRLFATRRINLNHFGATDEEWFSSILQSFIPTPQSDDEPFQEDFEALADHLVNIIYSLRKNLAVNTRLTLQECCNWIVDDLKQKRLRATDIFDIYEMIYILTTSERNASILSWLLDSATKEQRLALNRWVEETVEEVD